jgi:hypothetical protein
MCALGQEQASLGVRLLMSGYTKSVKAKRFLVMIQCFVDDSGSDVVGDGIFVLASYAMEALRWEDFSERWDVQLRRPYAIEYLHMAEAEAGDGEFTGIDRVHRNRKVLDLAEVLEQCRPTPIYCAMRWRDYLTHIKGKVDPSLDNPYAVLFFKLMAASAQLQIEMNTRIPSEDRERLGIAFKPVDFIFDKQGSAVEQQCLKWFYALRERVPEPHKTIISNNPQFKDDKELVPLQAADMLAWHIRRGYAGDSRKGIFDLIAPDGMIQYEIGEKELEKIAYTFKTQPGFVE